MALIGRAFVNGREFLFNPQVNPVTGRYDIDEKLMEEFEAEKMKERKGKE